MFDLPLAHPFPLGLAPTTSAGTGAPVTPAPIAPAPAAPIAPGTPVATQGAAGQATTTADGSPTTQPAKPSTLSQLLGGVGPILLMLVVLYLFLFRGQKKDEKKRKSMIEEMKKGDTVMTIGGLIARVVSIDGDNVTLKIDESNNVKAVYTKRSIQQVITDDDKDKSK